MPSAILAAALDAVGIDAAPFRVWYYRRLARILGLRVIVRGALAPDRPRLLVSNHVSYYDIVTLGAVVAGEFIAKAEVARWPFFGPIAKATRVVFIDRKRSATMNARDQIQERLEAGATLVMFPEATSGDGNCMKPFKSALFTVAERHVKGPDGRERPVAIQPVSIAYTRLNGLPLGVGWRPFVAWYGDMELMPHLWRLVQLGSITAEVTFHPAVPASQFADRKSLAAYCERVAGQGVARLLAGREKS